MAIKLEKKAFLKMVMEPRCIRGDIRCVQSGKLIAVVVGTTYGDTYQKAVSVGFSIGYEVKDET